MSLDPSARRALHVLMVLTIAICIVVPAAPTAVVGPAKAAIADFLLPISWRQRWGMYAPDVHAEVAAMHLVAVDHEGRERPLAEALALPEQWTIDWTEQHSREDLRRLSTLDRNTPDSPKRTWMLRSVCERERRRGQPPVFVRALALTSLMAPPHEVAVGAPWISPPTRRLVETFRCPPASEVPP